MGTYHLWNLSVGLDHEDFQLGFFMNNIFDERYESLATFNNTLQQEIAVPGLPQMFSFRGTMFF